MALGNLYKNNFKEEMRKFTNPWRIFSLNDESGAVICDYPAGAKKPAIPIPYCEETMTGFEYQMAGLLISRGYVEEGKRLVYALHRRFDGERRNPWNEFECGSNYARSMASFALLPIFAGQSFDLSRGEIGFAPVEKGDYTTFWSLGGAFGTFSVTAQKAELILVEGELTLNAFRLPSHCKVKRVIADGREENCKVTSGVIALEGRALREKLEILFA